MPPRSMLGCIVAIALAGCGSAEAPPEQAGPPPTPPAAREQLPPDGRFLGFSDQTFTYTGGPERDLDQGVSPEREAADALGAGANAHRITLAWWPLERKPGQIDQRYLGTAQAFAQRIREGGGRVLVTLGVPPPWASADPGKASAAPRRDAATVAAFARYAALVAKSFPDALGIETWNEPNSRWFWGPRRADASQYVPFHQAAAAAIRRVRPQMPVVFGGLLAGAWKDRAIVAPSQYLRDAYAAGLKPTDYDVLAVHPYPPQRSSDRPRAVRAAMQDFDAGHAGADPDARVWVTETGATTTGDDGLPPAEQAEALNDVIDTLFADRRIEAVFLHTLYDPKRHGHGDRERGFGVLDGRRPKPAFCALRARARRAAPFSGC